MATTVGTPLGVTASHRSSPTVVLPPLPVTSGLQVHLDAADSTTFSYSSGVSVSQWRDKSGNARHFSQATASLQPQRTGTQNGYSVVAFDGADDYMASTTFTLPQPFTVCMAVNISPPGDFAQGWMASQGGNFQIYSSSSGGNPRIYAGSEIQSTGGSNGHDGLHTWGFVVTGASSAIYKDNVQTVTGNAGTNGTTTGLYISTERGLTAGFRLTGALFETVVYNRVINATERGQLQTYFVTKWGTPP